MNKGTYAHCVWPGAPTTPEEDRDELVYSKRDIDGLKSAMVTAVAKREEEIARLRKMYEREREIAEQWKTAAETQKENNLALLKEVERLKWDIRGLKYRQEAHKDLANQIHKQLQDALNTLNWYVDSSMAEYVDDAGVKAAETLERIQEGKQS